jgi:hypothetical protein
MISPSLKAEAIKHIFSKVMNKLGKNEAIAAFVVRKLEIVLT